MGLDILNKICRLTQDRDIFFVAYGKLNQAILQSIIATAGHGVYDNITLKKYSDTEMDNLVTVAIEMVQNISKYRLDTEHYNSDLIVITTNGNISISTSNLIYKKNKDKMCKMIEFLNSLDAQELRKHSREVIRKNRDHDENSAGLGLIEIARISKENIQYSFDTYNKDDNLLHFHITIIILGSK